MTYFLGKDVRIAMSTERNDAGIDVDATIDAPGTGAVSATAPILPRSATYITTDFDNISGAGELIDLVGVDVSLGSNDEDIKFMGINTILKAEVNKESTVTLTFKKKNNFWDQMFNENKRWGISGASAGNFYDGLTYLAIDHGYRLYLHLKASNTYITFPNLCIASHTVTLTADGVQEETIELMSQVNPTVQNSPYVTVTDISEL